MMKLYFLCQFDAYFVNQTLFMSILGMFAKSKDKSESIRYLTKWKYQPPNKYMKCYIDKI